MTSEQGYPDAMHDSFGPILDSFRCAAVRDDRRCQLFARHPDPHAHAFFDVAGGRASGPVRGGYPWHPRIVRWTDDGRHWFPARSERLRWCCMFRQ